MTFTIEGRCPTKGSTRLAGESDSSIALDYLRGLLRDYDTEKIVYFVHEGDPVSKARARFNLKTKRVYTPERTQTAQEAIAWRFRAAVRDAPWVGNIALVAVFYRSNHQRIDADNLMKLVMDAGTQSGIWKDDCQVTHQLSVVELDAERPRTIVALSPVTSSLNRHPDIEFICQRCGVTFARPRVYASGRAPQKYCSSACRAEPLGMACCPKCDTVFDRKKAGQRYCSDACRLSCVGRRKSAAQQRPPALCTKCGDRVSRREYLFCAKCRRKGWKPGSKSKPKVASALNGSLVRRRTGHPSASP